MPDPATPPTNPPVQAPAQPVPASPAVPVAAQAAPGGSSKSMIWVIVAAFLVVAILVGIGIYMYMQLKDSNPAFQQVSQNVQESLTSVENDLSGVEAKEVTEDFADIDKELNNL